MAPAEVVLRPYRRDDIAHFVALFMDGDVSGFVGGPRSREDSEELFASLIEGRHARAVAAFAVDLDAVMVGHAVLFRHDTAQTLELGYMIERVSWGRGIGTATARALLDAARERGATHAVGTVDLDNHASQKILARLGAVRSTERDDEGDFYVYRFVL